MRKTLILSVDAEMARFIQDQPGSNDPSALINRLFHEDRRRKGVQIDPAAVARMQQDDVLQEFELMMDENTPAAG